MIASLVYRYDKNLNELYFKDVSDQSTKDWCEAKVGNNH